MLGFFGYLQQTSENCCAANGVLISDYWKISFSKKQTRMGLIFYRYVCCMTELTLTSYQYSTPYQYTPSTPLVQKRSIDRFMNGMSRWGCFQQQDFKSPSASYHPGAYGWWLSGSATIYSAYIHRVRIKCDSNRSPLLPVPCCPENSPHLYNFIRSAKRCIIGRSNEVGAVYF